ncbi:D-glycero-beta-D-manno-heptose 1,7-bisphosphate 7-phosphatase [Sphingomonas changnyeongensis]|uniref:D,D-heptose 1,7-bisphosphate phosphatase n=1 Tax=Sphingomonas changnyeongensis TaxID=2698679 RepID=A0A7Z2NVL1_9SPHN|nr:HAD family hydrolase [Sphingomonas changnyeongensis]QHL90219.1 D-glycero-beta-D-manno-heptose 1,7-bisphosphate 7-phosphatase [Sphingomonas changnyeongensis]
MNSGPKRAAFLDRDGVINLDHGYIGRPEDFELCPGVPEALQRLRDNGFALIVVTNQSGIGRGYFAESDYQAVTQRMVSALAGHGLELAAVMHCPHTPDAGCTCRKPQPGLILSAAARLGIDLHRSAMFGDKTSDVTAGRAAGVGRCFFVGPAEQAPAGADGHGADLLSCVGLLLADQA